MHGEELSQPDESTLCHHFELNYTPIDTKSGRRLARRQEASGMAGGILHPVELGPGVERQRNKGVAQVVRMKAPRWLLQPSGCSRKIP